MNTEETALIDAFGSMQGRLVPGAWAGVNNFSGIHDYAGSGPATEQHSGAEESSTSGGGTDGEEECGAARAYSSHHAETANADVDTRGLLLVQEGDLDGAPMADPAELRARIKTQATYICTLEDDNTTLRERLEALEREVTRLRKRQTGEENAEDEGECEATDDGCMQESTLCSGQ